MGLKQKTSIASHPARDPRSLASRRSSILAKVRYASGSLKVSTCWAKPELLFDLQTECLKIIFKQSIQEAADNSNTGCFQWLLLFYIFN